MKYILLAVSLLGLINVNAQDSAKPISKSFVALAGGANMVYPTIPNETYYKFGYSFCPWFNVAYNHVFQEKGHERLGLQFSLGDAQYKENATNVLWHWPQQALNLIEADAGVFIGIKAGTFIWNNEIEVLFSYQTNNSWHSSDQGRTAYIYYQTGLAFQVGKNIALMPLIAFPLVDVGDLVSSCFNGWDDEWNMIFGYQKPFNSIRAGLSVTYNFNRRN